MVNPVKLLDSGKEHAAHAIFLSRLSDGGQVFDGIRGAVVDPAGLGQDLFGLLHPALGHQPPRRLGHEVPQRHEGQGGQADDQLQLVHVGNQEDQEAERHVAAVPGSLAKVVGNDGPPLACK